MQISYTSKTAFLAAGAILLALQGCGGDDESPADTGSASSRSSVVSSAQSSSLSSSVTSVEASSSVTSIASSMGAAASSVAGTIFDYTPAMPTADAEPVAVADLPAMTLLSADNAKNVTYLAYQVQDLMRNYYVNRFHVAFDYIIEHLNTDDYLNDSRFTPDGAMSGAFEDLCESGSGSWELLDDPEFLSAYTTNAYLAEAHFDACAISSTLLFSPWSTSTFTGSFVTLFDRDQTFVTNDRRYAYQSAMEVLTGGYVYHLYSKEATLINYGDKVAFEAWTLGYVALLNEAKRSYVVLRNADFDNDPGYEDVDETSENSPFIATVSILDEATLPEGVTFTIEAYSSLDEDGYSLVRHMKITGSNDSMICADYAALQTTLDVGCDGTAETLETTTLFPETIPFFRELYEYAR